MLRDHFIQTSQHTYRSFGINCRYSVAQMCTPEDTLAHILGALSLDDVMSHNELTTIYNVGILSVVQNPNHFQTGLVSGIPNPVLRSTL